ncbi:aminotransferase class IV [Aquiflexum gelatinilyticum]|uniref:branched-chain-amino-acid transaminase n=1 Tax=Aquiflexum gelatinilyticum TaxID=2961943 RepID=A0A9X2P5Y9_9BACT|nr:aminotransferase class IV [Aquiflexum gelatinilyticum]MCR9015451.1 aminotransferase class IV [Aquiflexum gelatinilyticum]
MNSGMVGFDTIFLYKHNDGIWADGAEEFHNRGFLFGDGLFETMVYSNGKIRFGNEHLERLNEGLKILFIENDGLSRLNEIENLLHEIWGNKKSLRVRWNVYRSGLGKYTPEENHVIESLQVQSLFPTPIQKEKAYLSQYVFIQKTPWSHCKTLSAIHYVMANLERKSKGFDEVILKNSDGFVCEGGSSNIFWIKNGQYFTPSLDAGCIAGVGRRMIISYLKENNIPILEGLFRKEELFLADQVFTSNVTGISYIKSIDDKVFDSQRNEYLASIFED